MLDMMQLGGGGVIGPGDDLLMNNVSYSMLYNGATAGDLAAAMCGSNSTAADEQSRQLLHGVSSHHH